MKKILYNKVLNIISSIKWFLKEIMKMYSTEKSYFSKKRVESGVGFAIAEWGMVFFLINKWSSMTTSDFGIWASIQFVVAGYMVTQIQNEKKDKRDHEDDEINN